MKIGDAVLVIEDHGNILWFATISDVNDIMIEVLYESGPMNGFHQWRESWELELRHKMV